MRDLTRSTPLRFAFVFAFAIFLLTGLVFAAIYQTATRAWVAELTHVFADEAVKAAAADDERLRRSLDLRLTRDFRRLNFVALFDARGALVFGNLDSRLKIPADGRVRYFADFRPSPAAPAAPTILVARRRADGSVIVLGRSLEEAVILRRVLFRVLAYGIVPLAAGALLLGFVAARRAAARLRAVDRSIGVIVNGDLHARLPGSTGFRELDELVGSVNRMLDEIERLLAQMAAVGDNIAHDLRAPVANVRAMLEGALKLAPKDESLRAPVLAALRQLDRAMKTIAALQRISAIEAEHRLSSFREVDLAALCLEMHEFFTPLAQAKGVSLSVIAPAPLTRRGDPDLLREALANLIDNALKFTPRGGAVILEAREIGGRAVMSVSDNGRGVPMAEKHDIFRRFVRLRSAGDTLGSGLGLSIVEAIARLHGWRLELEDNAPGARFVLGENPDCANPKI
jgi:signal transduction histidine kinase